MPAISIVTPSFNKGPYVAATIRSVVAQTMPDWEMIIVDSGSIDDSVARVREFSDPRIRLMETKPGGPGAARNHGLAHCQGEWVQFLDADDLLEPDQLARQMAASTDLCDVVVGSWQEFPADNPSHRQRKSPAGWKQPPHALRDSAIAFAPWAVHAAIVRRASLTPDLLWPVALDRFLGEDIAFWFRLLSDARVVYSQTAGALYRIMSPNCRTNHEPGRWFHGIHAAVMANLAFLCQTGRKPIPGQCEQLMRLYCGIWSTAEKSGAQEIMLRSLAEAQRWLREYFVEGGAPRPAMFLRRALGLKLFLQFFEGRIGRLQARTSMVTSR